MNTEKLYHSFHKVLRTEVRGDFDIHGTKFFQDAVFLQKSNIYDVVSLLNLWWTKKTCSLHEILTWLVITEKTENTKGAGGLQNHKILIFDGKQHILKIFGSMDVKITPDFCS